MRTQALIGQFLRELFVTGAWYWRVLAFATSLFLIGLPEWAARFPRVARMLGELDLPPAVYGLAGSLVIASYFAWRLADLRTPRVVFTEPSFGKGGRMRVGIKNMSAVRCEKLMCSLTAVYGQCSAEHPRDDLTYFTEFSTDLPLVLPTQSRLRKATAADEPLPTHRWALDPGQEKNIEIAEQFHGNHVRVTHESGAESFELAAQTTFCLKVTGDTAPIEAYFVVCRYQPTEDGPAYTSVNLARDKFEMLVMQQQSVDQLMTRRDI